MKEWNRIASLHRLYPFIFTPMFNSAARRKIGFKISKCGPPLETQKKRYPNFAEAGRNAIRTSPSCLTVLSNGPITDTVSFLEEKMTYALLEIRKIDAFREIVLANPGRRNSLSLKLISELLSVLAEPETMDTLGIIISASGPVFSSGHDFADMIDQDLDRMRDLMHACARLMQTLQAMPQPILAAVQGPAIAAGCQLALSCDLAVASTNAFFQTPGGRAGWFCFTPMVALTRSIGRKRAFEMLMSGEAVPATTACEWGMINRVVPPDQLSAEALALLHKVTRGSPQMRSLGKKAFYTQIDMPQAQAYQYATDLMALSGITDHPQERMKAFAEKRPPVFKQRKKNRSKEGDDPHGSE